MNTRVTLLDTETVKVEWPTPHAYGDTTQLSQAYLDAWQALNQKQWRYSEISYARMKRRVRLIAVEMDGAKVCSMTFEKVDI